MFTYIDLFAGCGGLSDGFEKTQKYKGIAHVEWDTIAAKTLEKRLNQKWGVKDSIKKVLRFDIQRTNELIDGWIDESYGTSKGLKYLAKDINKIDLVIGGPPCQAYSLAGRIRDEHGMENDYRNFLFESYLRVIKWAKPDILVFENVLGILSACPGGISIIDRIKTEFNNHGYTTLDNYKEAVFNLNEFGVPQKRTRVIIIGLNNKTYKKLGDPSEILKNFYLDFRKKYLIDKQVTAQEALKGLSKFKPLTSLHIENKKISHGPLQSKHLNHTPRFHSQRDIEIFKLLCQDYESGSNLYSSVEALKKLYTEKTGKKSAVHKYHVIKPNEPSNTIPAHLYKDGLRHILWDSSQARSLTVREAARLQSFDDDFEFLGSMGDQYKMIGNAVPPLFAYQLAQHLVTLLQKRI